MTNQLHLLLSDDRQPSWRLDEATRAAGRQGIAEARAAIRASRRRVAVVDHDARPLEDAA